MYFDLGVFGFGGAELVQITLVDSENHKRSFWKAFVRFRREELSNLFLINVYA